MGMRRRDRGERLSGRWLCLVNAGMKKSYRSGWCFFSLEKGVKRKKSLGMKIPERGVRGSNFHGLPESCHIRLMIGFIPGVLQSLDGFSFGKYL